MKPEPSFLDAKPGIDDGAYILDGVIKTVEGESSKLLRDQMKIYANNRFMFAFFDDQTGKIDAATGYAVWVDGILTETPIANQDGSVEGLNFEIALHPTAIGFTQSVRGMPADDGGTYDLDEVWKTLSTDESAFDGLWRLEVRDAADSASTNFTEIKLIGGGHFIFFQGFDHKGESIQHFGFGSMEIDESGMVTETGMASTLEEFSGKDCLVNMSLIDADHMTQTFIMNGVGVVQSYVRI